MEISEWYEKLKSGEQAIFEEIDPTDANFEYLRRKIDSDPETGLHLTLRAAIMSHDFPRPRMTWRDREVIDLYMRAIETGHPIAMYNLAILLIDRNDNDIPRIISLFEQALEKGVDLAAVELGKLYLQDTPYHDEMKAFQMFNRIEEHGSLYAKTFLGVFYMRGATARAIRILEPVSDKEFPVAMDNLATLYVRRGRDFMPRAIALLRQAIALGYHRSASTLLGIYSDRSNYHASIDIAEIVELYNLGKAYGYPVVQGMYQIIQDHVESVIKYMTSMADQSKQMRESIQQKDEYIAHLEYRPGGPGYSGAFEEWNKLRNALEEEGGKDPNHHSINGNGKLDACDD